MRQVPQTKQRRGWPRFRLRTLLIVTALSGVLLGWIAKERRQSAWEQRLAAETRAHQEGLRLSLAGPYDRLGSLRWPGWWRELARFALGERVLIVHHEGPPAELGQLAGLTNVRQLNARWTEAGPVCELAAFKRLEVATIIGTAFRDLSPVAELSGLKMLECPRTSVSDLTPLSGLSQLRVLILNGSPVSELGPLRPLFGLQQLSIKATNVSDLSPLTGIVDLTHLLLDSTPVSDLAPVANLTKLRALSIDGTRVTDLRPLAGLMNLERLSLEYTPVENLAPLSGLQRLRVLELSGTAVTDLSPLENLANLQSLRLENTAVADDQIAALQNALPKCAIRVGTAAKTPAPSNGSASQSDER